MTENFSHFKENTYRLFRGLRRTNPENDPTFKMKQSTPEPKRHTMVPVYDQPVLAHCIKYGEFIQWKIVGHKVVYLDSDEEIAKSMSEKESNDDEDDAKPFDLVDDRRQVPTEYFYKKYGIKEVEWNKSQQVAVAGHGCGRVPVVQHTKIMGQFQDTVYRLIRGLRMMAQADGTICGNNQPIQVLRRPQRMLHVYDLPLLEHYISRGALLQWQLTGHRIVCLDEPEDDYTYLTTGSRGTVSYAEVSQIVSSSEHYRIKKEVYKLNANSTYKIRQRDYVDVRDKIYQMYQQCDSYRHQNERHSTGHAKYDIRMIHSQGNKEHEAYNMHMYCRYRNRPREVNKMQEEMYRICSTYEAGKTIFIITTKPDCFIGEITAVVPPSKATSTLGCFLGNECKGIPQTKSSHKPDVFQLTSAHKSVTVHLSGDYTCDVQPETANLTAVDCVSGDININRQDQPTNKHGRDTSNTTATYCPDVDTLKAIPQAIRKDEQGSDISAKTANTTTGDFLAAEKLTAIPQCSPIDVYSNAIQATTTETKEAECVPGQESMTNTHSKPTECQHTTTPDSEDDDEDGGLMCGILGVYTTGQNDFGFAFG